MADPTDTTNTLPGEFTQRTIAQPAVTPDELTRQHNPIPVNPISTAHMLLITELGKLLVNRQVPSVRINPIPEEFEDLHTYALQVAAAVDAWWLAVGKEARANATCTIDLKWFTTIFTEAIEGWGTSEFDRAAEGLREDQEDIESAVRSGRTARAIIRTIQGERGL